MIAKKLAIFGVVALVVIGCVVAAGCTSTSTTSVQTTSDDKNDVSTDPFVGFWVGKTKDDAGVEVNSTLVIKNDGTGACYDVYDDKAVIIYPLTWKKNSDSKYSLLYSRGNTSSLTLNDAKDTLVTSSGNTQKKVSPDSALNNSIIGVWYNKDSNEAGVFNADKTGFIRNETGIAEFTWKTNDSGKVAITFNSGTDRDNGSSIADKTFEWTYDSKTDRITTSNNENFVRPSESIKDRITIMNTIQK